MLGLLGVGCTWLKAARLCRFQEEHCLKASELEMTRGQAALSSDEQLGWGSCLHLPALGKESHILGLP